MAKMGWLKKIHALKQLLAETGPLWPKSTKLAGYAEKGPYHCSNCEYLKKGFVDENGKGRCNQEVMIADPDVPHDDKHLAIVNIEKGCCEFVEPEEE